MPLLPRQPSCTIRNSLQCGATRNRLPLPVRATRAQVGPSEVIQVAFYLIAGFHVFVILAYFQ